MKYLVSELDFKFDEICFRYFDKKDDALSYMKSLIGGFTQADPKTRFVELAKESEEDFEILKTEEIKIK